MTDSDSADTVEYEPKDDEPFSPMRYPDDEEPHSNTSPDSENADHNQWTVPPGFDKPDVDCNNGMPGSSSLKTTEQNALSGVETTEQVDLDPIDDNLYASQGTVQGSFSGGNGWKSIKICKEMTTMDNSVGMHYFLIDRESLSVGATIPHPESFTDKWQLGYFHMPCSPVARLQGSPKDSDIMHWDVVKAQLSGNIVTVEDLVMAMETYSPGVSKISGYSTFFHKSLWYEKSYHFFNSILPKLKNLALSLPSVVTQSIPLLKQGVSASLTLSQQQIACLLANSFLNTFPGQHSGYPVPINCREMFNIRAKDREKSGFAKISCLLNYFERVTNSMPNGVVSFHRRVLDEHDRPQWEKINQSFTKCHVKSQGLIEEHEDLLQADFANKFVGGGVLRTGCVQEEIRFVICPELIVSRLFTQQLLDNEALVIQGAERFCDYSGYARTFQFTGDYIDTTPQDALLRKYTTITAIDASVFRFRKDQQFNPTSMIRELNKAYIGFKPVMSRADGTKPTAVATGNWGCGAFGGEPLLKFVLQWMAASVANRDFVYLTFENVELARQLADIVSFVKDKPLNISEMWKLLCRYNRSNKSENLHQFLCG